MFHLHRELVASWSLFSCPSWVLCVFCRLVCVVFVCPKLSWIWDESQSQSGRGSFGFTHISNWGRHTNQPNSAASSSSTSRLLLLFFYVFFSFLFFWLHFAHKNTNMATERRLHLFLSMCCCCFWLFCYFLFSCGTKEFIFRVLKLAQNNVFCIFFSTLKLTVFEYKWWTFDSP